MILIANVAVPVLPQVTGQIGMVFLIPIIVIEAAVMRYLLRNHAAVIGWRRSLVGSVLANGLSSLAGVVLMGLIRDSVSHVLMLRAAWATTMLLVSLVPMLIFSWLVEAPVWSAMTDLQWRAALKPVLVANVVTYGGLAVLCVVVLLVPRLWS